MRTTHSAILRRSPIYARKGGWVTIGAHEGEGGTPVYLDDSGKITRGPSHLEGKKPSELSGNRSGKREEKPKAPQPKLESELPTSSRKADPEPSLPKEHVEAIRENANDNPLQTQEKKPKNHHVEGDSPKARKVAEALPSPQEWRDAVRTAFAGKEEWERSAANGDMGGICDQVSEIMRQHLATQGVKAEVVYGLYETDRIKGGYDEHAWLETSDGLVIDPSECQFRTDVTPGEIAVYASRPSRYKVEGVAKRLQRLYAQTTTILRRSPLYARKTFDESKVSRDHGQFSSKPGGSGEAADKSTDSKTAAPKARAKIHKTGDGKLLAVEVAGDDGQVHYSSVLDKDFFEHLTDAYHGRLADGAANHAEKVRDVLDYIGDGPEQDRAQVERANKIASDAATASHKRIDTWSLHVVAAMERRWGDTADRLDDAWSAFDTELDSIKEAISEAYQLPADRVADLADAFAATEDDDARNDAHTEETELVEADAEEVADQLDAAHLRLHDAANALEEAAELAEEAQIEEWEQEAGDAASSLDKDDDPETTAEQVNAELRKLGNPNRVFHDGEEWRYADFGDLEDEDYPGAEHDRKKRLQRARTKLLNGTIRRKSFDESKVSRTADGKFGSGGGSTQKPPRNRNARKRGNREKRDAHREAVKAKVAAHTAGTPTLKPKEQSKVGLTGKVRRTAALIGRAAWNGLVGEIKQHGTDVKHVEHAVSQFVQEGADERIAKLPEKVRGPVAAAWFAVRLAGEAAMASFTTGQELSRRVAKERGATPEQAERLSQRLAGWDIGLAKPAVIAAEAVERQFGSHSGIGLALGFVPLASLGYLAYSTVRDPDAVIRAAHSVIGGATKNVDVSGGEADVAAMLEAIRTHGSTGDAERDDWFDAVLSAGIDRHGSLSRATAAAIKAVGHFPSISR